MLHELFVYEEFPINAPILLASVVLPDKEGMFCTELSSLSFGLRIEDHSKTAATLVYP